MIYDVIIIGGGASGLFCAITAGKRERNVLVLESSNKLGKKILMSGGGRCNFTNLNIEPEYYISANPHFCKSALNRYTQWDFIKLVENHGIAFEERKHGQLFCKGSAKEILMMLRNECDKAAVKIHTHCEVTSITAPEYNIENQYILNTSLGKIRANSLVIASGGLSIPKMGASNFSYKIAKQFRIPVLSTYAGLVPFTFSNSFKDISERLSGVSQEVILSTPKKQFQESILFTHRGLSGPAALQLSSYWNHGESIQINLFPDEDIESLLINAKSHSPRILLRNFLSQYLAKKLVILLQELFWSNEENKLMTDFSNKRLKAIAAKLYAWEIKPSGTEGYRTAEVTMGGIDTDYLSSQTMETKNQPGLYFIGEAVDVTGHLGGFNFQWAWSSGYVAGQYA